MIIFRGLKTYICLIFLSHYLFFGDCTVGSDKMDLLAVLDLPYGDFVTINPEKVIKECSLALTAGAAHEDEERALLYHRRGDAYLALWKCEPAKRDYDQTLKIQPQNLTVRWKKARVILAEGDEKQAIADFQNIIKNAPDFPPPYTTLAGIQLSRKENSSAVAYATKAIDLIEKTNSIDFSPLLPNAYYYRSVGYYYQGKFTQALSDINKCIELEPLHGLQDQEKRYIFRGEIHLLLDNPRAAVSNSQIARRLNPKSFEATYLLWRAYQGLSRNFLACFVAEELIRLDQNNYKAYLSYALSLNRIGKFSESAKASEKSLGILPNNPDCYATLGDSHNNMKHYKTALENYDQAIHLAPNHLLALVAKAQLLATCPDKKFRNGIESKRIAVEACKISKNDHRCQIVLALAHAECGEFKEAVALATKCLEAIKTDEGLRELYKKYLHNFEMNRAFHSDSEENP